MGRSTPIPEAQGDERSRRRFPQVADSLEACRQEYLFPRGPIRILLLDDNGGMAARREDVV